MKKISILSVFALMGISAMAQEAVLKAAEKLVGKGDYTEVVAAVTPAMSDPTTKDNAMTYYLPGKAAFKQYDDMIAKEALGQLDEAGVANKAKALIAGYDFYLQALPLDSVVDAKGKIKTKYSKDIVNTIGGHYNDFINAGVALWGVQDYKGAYEAWEAYTSLPSNPTFVKALPGVPADSTIAEIMFNQALAAWQMEDLPKSLQAFLNAKDKGYHKKQLYDYAIAVATGIGNNDAVDMLAKEANGLYGDEDPNYIGYIINGFINRKDYPGAINAIDQAIAADPSNAQYHVMKGILYESDEINKDAKPEYAKAVELDGHNAQALYNLGRMYYNNAMNIYNDAPNDNAEFNRVFNEEFKPEMLQAVDLFERAYTINEENFDLLKLLENAYYLLNDETNLNATKARMGK